MYRTDVLYLVAEDPEAHGIFEATTETDRMVYCTIRSVGYQEYYRALEQDLHPTLIFILADYAEYQGEKICIWNNVRYRIIRTYQTGGAIELTVEEATVDG